MIRVGFLEEGSQIGGAEINVLSLIKGLDPTRIETVVICPFEGPFTQRVREIGGEVVLVWRAPLFSTSVLFGEVKISNPLAMIGNLLSFLASAWVLAKYLRREGVNILHTNSMLAHFYGALAARLAGIPCLWHVQDIVDERQLFGMFRKSLNWVGRFLPERIVVVSESVAEVFDASTRGKVRVIYNGTNVVRNSLNGTGERIRRELGIGLQDPVVGMVGRIVHWKGHQDFLQAAQQVHEQIPPCRFLVVGDASFGSKDYEFRMRKLATELGLGGVVVFTGFRSDIPDLISTMDIVVNASELPEPFGLSVVEAMAHGKPVVATAGGGIPEIIVNGVTGTLVPMNDGDALGEAIVDLLRAPERRHDMGEAGRRRAEERFTIDRFVQEMSQEYLQLTRKPRRLNSWE